jgi:hypothetical protein
MIAFAAGNVAEANGGQFGELVATVVGRGDP